METCFATQLATEWQPFLHITPSAVLVLVWNYLMFLLQNRESFHGWIYK